VISFGAGVVFEGWSVGCIDYYVRPGPEAAR